MTNKEIASLLRKVAAAYTVKGENRFRIVAYERAADEIENYPESLRDLWREKRLGEIEGVGQSLQGHLEELFKKGKVGAFERYFKRLPKGMFEILGIPGIGPKTAYRLAEELGVSSVEDLEKKARKGLIAQLEGFGEVSQREILRGVEEYKLLGTRMLLPVALPFAETVSSYLKKCPAVLRVDTLGSLRRWMPTVGDVDLACATRDSEAVLDCFISFDGAERVIERGEAKAAIKLKDGPQVDIRVQDTESYGSLLQHFTGSKEHNIQLRELAIKKGLSLSEYGIKKGNKLIKFPTEEKFYRYLGLSYIEPELREANGEIEAARFGKLPNLVSLADIKGDFHVHSDFDTETSHDLGTSSFETLIRSAESLGYSYIGFSDHNPSIANHTEQQIISLVKKRSSLILQAQKLSKKVRVFNLLEVDILPDGRLSLPDRVLSLLDFAIVSIHSSFGQPTEVTTERILKALSHPKAQILGHPTARLLNQRSGVSADWDAVFEYCAKHNKFIEINAYPQRLDLPDTLVRHALSMGVKFVIDTDSHAAQQLDLMRYGVSVARRGWCPTASVVNALSTDSLVAILST